MDILEEWGNGWATTLHHTGGSTHKCLLVQDIDERAKFTGNLRISDVPSDWVPLDLAAPHPGAELEGWRRQACWRTATSSAGSISIYGGTNDDPRHLYVENRRGARGLGDRDQTSTTTTWPSPETQAERRANNVLK